MYLKEKPASSAMETALATEMTGERQSATLTQSVYAQLRADILSGRMRPGEKIRAEALRKLSGRRIELSQRDGLRAIVDQPSVEARRVGTAWNRDGIGLRRLQ